jgi:hypothetical protein
MSTKDTIGKYNLTEPKLYMSYVGWYLEEFEDTKEAIRNRISKKNRQGNGQEKKSQKDKQRATKYTYKTKDRVTRTPLKTEV